MDATVAAEVARLDGAARERLAAVRALAALGAPARAAIPRLVPIAADPAESDIWPEARHALARIDPTAEAALPAMVDHFIEAGAAKAIEEAIRALHRPSVRAIANLLSHQDLRVALAATDHLEAREGEARAAVDLIAGALARDDSHLKHRLMVVIERLGPAAGDAVPALIEEMRTGPIPYYAAETLAAIGEPAVPALARALRDSDPDVGHRAAKALRLIGPAAHAAVASLVDAIASDDPLLAELGLWALAEIGPPAAPAVPGIIRILRTEDASEDLVDAALAVLWELGPAAGDAIPELLDRLPDPEYRDAAAGALGGIGASAVEPLVRTLADPRSHVRASAIVALGIAGPAARSAVPHLIRSLDAPDGQERVNAVQSLASVGRGDHTATLALIERLRRPPPDDDHLVRWCVIEALGAHGQDSSEAIAALIDELATGTMPDIAANALKTAGAVAVPALRAAMDRMAEDRKTLANAVIEALGRG